MLVGIQIDSLSGHLFHEIELLMILFSRCYDQEVTQVAYVHDTYDVERRKATPYSIRQFKSPGNISCINTICNRLFGVKNITIETDIKSKCTHYVRRADLNQRDIGKAFAENILNFPSKEWYERLTGGKTPSSGLLYAARQNKPRRLTNEHDLKLRELVKQYDGTIIDDFSKHTLSQQIDIFSDHTCLMGVHGNNLTGCMWMSPESVVLELLRSNFDKHRVYDFQAMSWCMKHHYSQFICHGIDVEEWRTIRPWTYTDDTFNLLRRNLHLWNQLYQH